MKALLYNETPKGTRVLVVIQDAKLNPLQAAANALEHVKSLEDYATLESMSIEQQALVQRYQKQRLSIDQPAMRSLLMNIQTKRIALKLVQKEYEAANPVYLKPVKAILVDNDLAASIEGDIREGEYITLEVAEDESLSYAKLTGASMGKKYRLPDSLEWVTVEHPDDTIPADAIYTDPTQAETDAHELEFFKGLDPDNREAMKAAYLKAIEDELVRACVLADNLGGANAADDKAAAVDAYNAATTALDSKFTI